MMYYRTKLSKIFSLKNASPQYTFMFLKQKLKTKRLYSMMIQYELRNIGYGGRTFNFEQESNKKQMYIFANHVLNWEVF